MTSRRLLRPAVASAALALAVAAVPAHGQKPPAGPASPWFVDDNEILTRLTEKVGQLAADGKCLPPNKLARKAARDRVCAVTPAKPGDKRLDPEEVYELARPGVFVLGSVVKAKDEDGNDVYLDGRMATAWVLSADGVLVTSRHVFDAVEESEFYGVMDHRGKVYPVTDVIGVDRAADVAVFRVAADGLTPLAVAEKPAAVGSWVGVLGHPGDQYFTFTQGSVTRYSTARYDDGTVERWMAVTADYAYGSSGSPVLDRRGAVVGMAAMTENIDFPEPAAAAGDPKKPARRRQPPKEEKKAEPAGSLLQMVVKLTVPAADIRKVIGAE
jgi:S1-C subfamily serine protease